MHGAQPSTVGMWKDNRLINLHLLTRQIGKPGAGPFSLTGQPNAMGRRETRLLSDQLPAYTAAWRMTPTAGLTAVEMFRALEKG
jgi:assimilatory nitrate reductase catalytic subunit